jgi:putative transposase
MVQQVIQALIELEVEQPIGAGRHERTPSRTTQRNGYRERALATRVGELERRIPKLRCGSFFPSLLEPRRRAEKALMAVVQEAYPAGSHSTPYQGHGRRGGAHGLCPAQPRRRPLARDGNGRPAGKGFPQSRRSAAQR